VSPTLAFASAGVVAVKNVNYLSGQKPLFTGTATAGATIDLILTGTKVAGARIIGTVVADSAGNYQFHLPTGLKKGGSFTLVARAHGMYGSADKASSQLSFKTGPAPHVKAPKAQKAQTKAHKPAASARSVVRVKPAAAHAPKVQAASIANGHLVDHAVQALILNGLPFKKKGH